MLTVPGTYDRGASQSPPVPRVRNVVGPVHEVLVGWHVGRGYLWPYVLATYLLSPLIVGLTVRSTA